MPPAIIAAGIGAAGAIGSRVIGRGGGGSGGGGGGGNEWIAPAIGAGGQVISGLIGARAVGQSRESQERANAEALAFSREQAEADRAYRQQLFNVWLAQRNALLSRYGITVPSLGGGAMAPSPGAVPRGAPPPAAGPPVGVPPGGGAPNGGLAALGAMPVAMTRTPELGSWNDWARLGLRRG